MKFNVDACEMHDALKGVAFQFKSTYIEDDMVLLETGKNSLHIYRRTSSNFHSESTIDAEVIERGSCIVEPKNILSSTQFAEEEEEIEFTLDGKILKMIFRGEVDIPTGVIERYPERLREEERDWTVIPITKTDLSFLLKTCEPGSMTLAGLIHIVCKDKKLIIFTTYGPGYFHTFVTKELSYDVSVTIGALYLVHALRAMPDSFTLAVSDTMCKVVAQGSKSSFPIDTRIPLDVHHIYGIIEREKEIKIHDLDELVKVLERARAYTGDEEAVRLTTLPNVLTIESVNGFASMETSINAVCDGGIRRSVNVRRLIDCLKSSEDCLLRIGEEGRTGVVSVSFDNVEHVLVPMSH